MAATRPRQDQIKSGDAYDDDVPAGATMVSGAETLQDDLNAIRSQIKRLGGGANWYDEPAPAGAGWIYVANITVPSGTATGHVWDDPPDNTILQEVTVSSLSVAVAVRASFPKVTIGSTPAVLDRDISGGFYAGTVNVVLPSPGELVCQVTTPDGEEGASDTVNVLLDAPPVITSALFTGDYPGIQTELKAGDVFGLFVVADKLFDQVEVVNHEAGAGQVDSVADTLSAAISVLIANRGNLPVARYARVRVRDAVTGAWSATYDTNATGSVDKVNTVVLNNVAPAGAVSSITYPIGQGALKATEGATVNHTATGYDVIAYDDPTSPDQLSIANPSTFEAAKAVTATGQLLFNNSSPNFRYTMTRNANGAQTVVTAVVIIAAIAPTITVSESAARLRSGGNNGTAAQDHAITLTSSQPLLSAPTLDADSGGLRGALQGVWAGGPSVWTRLLRVSEILPDEKGTFAWSGLVATGLAGLVQSAISGNSTYVLGGFVSRALAVTPFADGADIGTSVVDFTKLAAVEIPELGLAMVKQPIGTPVQLDTPANESKRGWYTIDATDINPTRLLLLHQGTIDGNAAGMTITGVQEAV